MEGDMRGTALFFCVILLLIFTPACTDSKGQKQEPVFKQVPEIQEVKPEKPVKIKLKRNAKDDYSWEISGDDAEEIVNADKGLRKGLKTE
jgi:hypothetical protein